MRGLDRDTERQVEEIRDLKTTIRRFEQEVGLIAEQQHKDTEEFIRNLHRNRVYDDIGPRYSMRATSPDVDNNGISIILEIY